MLAWRPASAAAQAFTAPEGIGGVTLSWQFVDNTGHRGTDGFLVSRGESVTMSVLAEIDYAVTDRLSVSGGAPYVFAKYTGGLPSFSRLPVDECKCWHSSFQDASVGARYRLGTDFWAVTPLVRFGAPTHSYPYQGEAVVGRNLRELQLGVSAGLRLTRVIPRASVQSGYTYSFVQKALDDIPIDRSNLFLDLGYPLSERLYVRGTGVWQHTHGGVRAGSASGHPFPLPGELNTPLRFSQRDRILRTHYWQLGGGVSYSAGPLDLFASFMKYVWGRDAHNGQVYNVGSTWYFDLAQ
jgi:hypothetical protein